MQEPPELPSPNMRDSYKIGQAAEILGIKPFVLRYWETEFACLVPRRTPKGQRYYTQSDIELIRRIRDLLYVEKLTIEGARQALAKGGEHQPAANARQIEEATPAAEAAAREPHGALLRDIEAELREIRRMLER